MANGQPDGLGSEAISGSFSPEITHYLLVVIGEPLSEEYVSLALADVEKALQCWDVDDAAIGYDAVLQAAAAADVNKVGLVHRSLAHCGTSVGVVVLINPTSSEVTAELRNLLIHPATNKHLIFGGHWLEGNGDWVLHNDTFTLHDVADIFSEPDVDAAVLKASQDERQTLVVSGCHWQTAAVTKQTFTKSLNLTINPQEVKNDVAGISLLVQTIRNNVQIPSPFELLEPPTMGVGVKCKITKPTVLIFPAGKGDCAFFAVTDFSIFLGGGYCTKSCFWKFAKHLHRIDAIMAPHMQPDSLMGFNSLLKRKIAEQKLTEPEKGSEEYEEWSVKCNSPEVGVVYLNAPENKKSPESLQLKTISQGNQTQQLLQELGIKPFSCTSNVGKVIEPVTLYQKVGIGRLDMFILSPIHDSKELKDFMLQWSGNKAFSKVKTGMKVNAKESECPMSSAVSICALIVWQPANPHEDIVKVLFPGNAPQAKILEGLDRLKHLDYLKYPDVTAAKLSKGGASLKKKPRVTSGKTPVKANGPSPVVVSPNDKTPCTDGVHCNTPPPDDGGADDGHSNIPPPCTDGTGCGTPPPEVQGGSGRCTDGANCNTPPPEEAVYRCTDGANCNTPPPEETVFRCTDGANCNTPPPEEAVYRCTDGANCNTPPPEEAAYTCHDGEHCGTPPPEDAYEDTHGTFAPIEPYKCPGGNQCNTPPPDGDGVYADSAHCSTPPPEDEGVMDTQQSPVDNEPQATVQGDICGNLMDSNLPESQQDMGAFSYGGAPDPYYKSSDTPERLASGEITPSDQVEYGDESSTGGTFVFDAEARAKEPAPVPVGFGDYAEEDHAAASPSDGLAGEYGQKRELSDEGESPTDGTQGISGGAFDDETPSPNEGPHPWEPRIEFSSPDQEPEDNFLVEEPRPEADTQEQSEPASFGFSEIPPPVGSYDDQTVEEMEAQPSPQEYSQDGQFEQQGEVAEEEEEEDTSEASQASEIEVKPDQQFAEETQMTYEEQAPVSHSLPADSEDIAAQDDAEMDVKDQEDAEQVEVTSVEQSLDQGLEAEEPSPESVIQAEVEEMRHQDVVAEEEQLLEAEIQGGPLIQMQSSEGQEEIVAGEEQGGEMEVEQAGNVESPAPEEDQDQVVPEGEYEGQVAPTEEPVTEAWSYDSHQEINQNFMPSSEIPSAMEEERLEPKEVSPQPEADIEDNRQIPADEMTPLEEPEADVDVEIAEGVSKDLAHYGGEPSEEEPVSQEYEVDEIPSAMEEERLEPEEVSPQPEADIEDNRQIPADEMTPLEEPEADVDDKIAEGVSKDLAHFGGEPSEEEPVSQEYEAEEKMQVIQDIEGLSDQPEVLQGEPLEEPGTVEYSVEAQEVQSMSEPVPDAEQFSQPPVSEPVPQTEIIVDSVPEYDVEASYEQDIIQEEESAPDQMSSSEPLVDSLSEPISDKEPDSLSEPQIDQVSEPIASPEPDAEPEPVQVPSAAPILEASPQRSPEPQPESEPDAEPEVQPEPVEISPTVPIVELSPQRSPEPIQEPPAQPSPEPQPEPQPMAVDEVTGAAKADKSATPQTTESQPDVKPKTVKEISVKAAVGVTTKTTTKTSTTTAATTKKPGDKATKKDVKGTKSTTKSTTKSKTSTLTEKKMTTKTPTAGTKKSDLDKHAGVTKKQTTSTTEQKSTVEKKAAEKKPLERKSLAERKPAATEKKTSRLSATKTTTGTPRSQTTNGDKSPSKPWEKHTAASVSRSSSSNNSRTKTNGSGDTKPGPTRKPTPSKFTPKTPPKTGTQRPTGSRPPGSGKKLTESGKKEPDRLTRSAPSKTGDARKSDNSKRSLSAKTSTSAAKTQAVPVSGPPVYIDLTYIPNHASEDSVNMEFFRRIRSKNYVISANDKGRHQPSVTVMEALLEGKAKWEDPEAEVTVIPTYDIGTLHEWEQKNLGQLTDSKVTISQPASRSIVQMKDENFFMYKVEF